MNAKNICLIFHRIFLLLTLILPITKQKSLFAPEKDRLTDGLINTERTFLTTTETIKRHALEKAFRNAVIWHRIERILSRENNIVRLIYVLMEVFGDIYKVQDLLLMKKNLFITTWKIEDIFEEETAKLEIAMEIKKMWHKSSYEQNINTEEESITSLSNDSPITKPESKIAQRRYKWREQNLLFDFSTE